MYEILAIIFMLLSIFHIKQHISISIFHKRRQRKDLDLHSNKLTYPIYSKFLLSNPVRTWAARGGGCFSPPWRFLSSNYSTSNATHSKFRELSYNLTSNKVKVTNFQNWQQKSRHLTIFDE